MAEKTLNVRFKQKYDTSTNWSEKNTILLAGEIGIESDTNKMKVGDGTTEWNNLEYISAESRVTLYVTTGQNTDGAMTQKAVSDELDKKASIEDIPIYKSNECKAFAIITRYDVDYATGPSTISAFECSKFGDLSVGDKILVIGTYYYTNSSNIRYNYATHAIHIATINSFSTASGYFTVSAALYGIGGVATTLSTRNFAFDTEIPTIDSALSTTSENTVQNKVVTSAINELGKSLSLKANDNAVMHTTGNETIGGIKTFTNEIIVPDVTIS